MANVNPIEVLINEHAVHTMVLAQESTGVKQCLNCGRWTRGPRNLLESVPCIDIDDTDAPYEEVT